MVRVHGCGKHNRRCHLILSVSNSHRAWIDQTTLIIARPQTVKQNSSNGGRHRGTALPAVPARQGPLLLLSVGWLMALSLARTLASAATSCWWLLIDPEPWRYKTSAATAEVANFIVVGKLSKMDSQRVFTVPHR